ncbi:hypothetical protein JCM8097_009242 [Rhodosporidiobolus ruineniae]
MLALLPPPTTPAKVPREPPRKRYRELSELGEAAHRLAFRSLPYATDPSTLFPQTPLHFTHSCPLFTLRCFPSPRTPSPPSPSSPPLPRRTLSPDSRRHRPTPPPALLGSTRTPTPSNPDALVPSAEAHHALLSRHAHAHKPYTLSLTLMVGKKKVHKSAVIRERVKRRVREAVRLVVVRGARAEASEEKGEKGVRLRERKDGGEWETGPRRWLLPGYHYVLSVPSLDLYRVPLPELVEHLRKALLAVKRKAEEKTLTLRLADLEILPDPDPSALDLNPSPLPPAQFFPPTKRVEGVPRPAEEKESAVDGAVEPGEGVEDGEGEVVKVRKRRAPKQRSWEETEV